VTDESKQPPAKPRPVLLATIALGLTALFSVLTAVGASSQRDWVERETAKTNASAVASAISSASSSAVKKSADVTSAVAHASTSATGKYPAKDTKKFDDSIDTAIKGTYISGLFTLLILGLLAWGTFRGRHWSRWAVTGIYVLSLFTPLGVGPLNLLGAILGNGEPLAIRGPVLVAGLAMLAAVVLVNLRPSVEFFALSRPTPRPGQPQRRGLFSRPAAPASGNQPRRTASRVSMKKDVPAEPSGGKTIDKAAADRARTKKRTNTDSVARGAELARNRAKASKSRRTDR
jgi:hypothetical protein